MQVQLSPRQLKRIQQIPLEQDFGHAPIAELGGRDGIVLAPFIEPWQEVAANWQEWLYLWAKRQWRKRCFRPQSECQAELVAFSAALSRWLVQLCALDSSDKRNIIAIENDFVALKIRVEQGILGQRAEFSTLFRCFARQHMACLSVPALQRIAECAHWLLAGKDDGIMRSLVWRNEFRRKGFGLYEDLFRHMPADQFARFMLEHQVLDETAPELFTWLRAEAQRLQDTTS